MATASLAIGIGLGHELSSAVAEREEPAIGARMQNGTVYVGASPETGRPMYTTPEDAPGTYTFNQARAYCAGSDDNGREDWRVPYVDEVRLLFNNRAAIGGFNESGAEPDGWSR